MFKISSKPSAFRKSKNIYENLLIYLIYNIVSYFWVKF